MDNIRTVAEQFILNGAINNIKEFGNGNINDTYLVEVSGAGEKKFVLQRINTHVFSKPELIIKNFRTLTDHVEKHLSYGELEDIRRWEIPTIRTTVSGEDFHIDSQGGFWRGISYIANACSYDTIQDENHAFEAGYALGRFQYLTYGLDTNTMHDTLVGFHITPRYLSEYDEVRNQLVDEKDSQSILYCQRIIEAHRQQVSVLENARNDGKLSTHIIHGDPKINNFMISNQTHQAVGVVDLDTVKPGLLHYDIGDCLRSACNPLGEETRDFAGVYFNVDVAELILDGYLSVARSILTRDDIDNLFDAIWLIPFELGLRFYTDELLGNVYFKVNYPGHNFDRALVQFKLTESIESQEETIRAMIRHLLLEKSH